MLWSLLFISPIALCNATELNGTTSQSTDYEDSGLKYTSERAVDGNVTTCANTKERNNSWWRIDLQGVYTISSISIYNIQKTHTNIAGSQIYIGFSQETNVTTKSLCANITTFKEDHFVNFTCYSNLSGRYVTIFFPQEKPGILCEVKIFGTIKESYFQLVNERKTWVDALDHCREQGMDLASIVGEETQTWAELEAQRADTSFVWLGLRYTCALQFWFWVDDESVKFNRWGQDSKKDECKMSGVMENETHSWSSKQDSNMYNFICAKPKYK